MTQNAQDVWKDIAWIVLSIGVLLVFAVGVAWPHRAARRPGRADGRPDAGQGQQDAIRPDSYVESFANEVSSGGGGLPALLKVAVPGILLWWLLYLIVNWSPR